MIILRIKKKEFDLIKLGVKKSEWRSFSTYNKKLFGVEDKEKSITKGKKYFSCRKDISEILLVNGYKKDSPKMIIYPELIQLAEFTKDINIPNDNFIAKKGDIVFEIKIKEFKII